MAQTNAYGKTRPAAAAGASLPITDILLMTLRHWPWLLLSVAVCTGLAMLYLMKTPDVYTRSAELMIKDSSSGKSSGAADFADYGLFSTKSNISNEISTLKSKDLMLEVVQRLNLDVNYFRDGRLHKTVAYGDNLPVAVHFVDMPAEAAATFDLDVAKNGALTLSHFECDGRESKEKINAAFGDTISTIAGPVVVEKSNAYTVGEAVTLHVSKIPTTAAQASYSARFSAEKKDRDKGTVLTLRFSDQSVQRADDVLNTIIGVYNEYWLRDRNQIAVSTSNFINDRLGVIESELGNVDNDISSYKSQHLIPNLEAASSLYMNQNQQIAQEMLALNNQLQMTRYVRSYLTADDARDKLLPSNSGITNADINSQIGEYNANILQRNALIAKSSEKNPLVVALDEQLDAQRSAIIATIDNHIVALNSQLSTLRHSEAQTTSRIASNPSQAKYLLSVERQQKVKESLYLFLLQKREENELSQAFTAYNTKVINRPGPSGVPPVPNRRNILMIAFVIGFVIPFGVVYLRETLNTRVRGRKDVEGLSLPFLGEIPQHGKGGKISSRSEDKDVHTLVVKPSTRDVINEAFRVVRTNVEFMRINHDKADVVVVTSFNPGSGKSFVTLNIAMALALKNKRVLVVDGDMRKASTSAFVGSPRQGLANYLSGANSDLESLVCQVPDTDGKLSVLPVGVVPPNPTELLESPLFEKMLTTLRAQYDYIFIDCPPIEVVADTQIVARYADRTVFVLRAGLFERAMLPELEHLYDEKRYRNMSYILNGTSMDGGRYASSTSYRYGYGYGTAASYGSGNSN
ncbi:MAG: polysaccharide biosynthesis tyrosine autokinase [Muribaculaceae bacterium]|nr:polysaccharide biosynthesis tyrosine autokinase [Muribaculaceae bacterium]